MEALGRKENEMEETDKVAEEHFSKMEEVYIKLLEKK